MNKITKTAKWLYGALGLQDPDIPTLLDTTAVLPTVEVTRGGWADARITRLALNRAASLASSREQIIAPDPNQTFALLALEITHLAGAGAAVVGLEIYNSISNTGIDLSRPSIAVDARDGFVQFFGSAAPVWIPAGYGFSITWPATALGETYSGELLYAAAPAGYRLG